MTKACGSPIESAGTASIRPLARLLAESLFDDPLQCWLFPAKASRMATSEHMFRRLLKTKVKKNLVRVIRANDGQIASVAVWTPPYPPGPTRWERYSDSFFMRRIFRRRIHEVRRGQTAQAARHPPQPYWYLQALATSPQERGKGFAKDLLEEKMRECDALGVMVVLEASNRANLKYYAQMGFEITHELILASGLPVWLMCHNAKQS